MALRYFAYGAAAASALVGGAIMFYTAEPGIGPTMDDMIELAEARNERWAALATTKHTGNPTNGWNFTKTAEITGLPVHQQMQAIMDDITNVCRYYYQSTGVVWTVSNLFVTAKIGPADGRPLYTVGFETNGTPIYSNKLGALIITNTFFECYRAFTNFYLTRRDGQWGGGTNYTYSDTSTWSADLTTGDTFPYDPSRPYAKKQSAGGPGYAPAWFTNITPYPFIAGDYTGLEVARVIYAADGTGAGASFEVIDMRQPTASEMQRVQAGPPPAYNDYWLYSEPHAHATEQAQYLDSTGGLWLATMDTSVVARVDIAWSYAGAWTNITCSDNSPGATVTTTLTSWAVSGTNSYPVSFTGLSTNWHTNLVVTGLTWRISQNVGGVFENEAAYGICFTGGESSFVDAFADIDLVQVLPTYLGGRADVTIGAAWINWTFSRCRP